MTEQHRTTLRETSLRVREHIIRMSTDGGCFIGASLSSADLLVYMYEHVLNCSPEKVDDPNRDYLLLSKGHDVPALYGVLAEKDFFPRQRLANHLKTNDYIYWHPNTNIPGIEFHSGSLGHLLSVGIGIAHDIRLSGGENNVYVVLGDGECNEGSVWEGVLVAAAHKLGNLNVIIDRNGFQANTETEKLVPLESLEQKFKAFGWNALRTNGHDFDALDETFHQLKTLADAPTVIIADTVRGQGLPSIERRADRWFVNFSTEEVAMLLDELHGVAQAELTSETLHVR